VKTVTVIATLAALVALNAPKEPAPTPFVAEQTVYRTKSGDKYHRDGCRYLKKSKLPLTRTEAESFGLSPCKVCKP